MFLLCVLVHKKLFLITSCSNNTLHNEEVHVDFGSAVHQDFCGAVDSLHLLGLYFLPSKNSEEQLEGTHKGLLMALFFTVSTVRSDHRG